MRMARSVLLFACLTVANASAAEEASGTSALLTSVRADALAAISPEHQLQIAVQAIAAGEDNDALKELYNLTQREPNFRLAQLLYGELLALRSGSTTAFPLNAADAAQLKELQEEYRVRVGEGGLEPAPGSLPADILELSGNEPYVLLADLSRSRLYVLSNRAGHLEVVDDFYTTLARKGFGKHSAGDLLTPVGIYRATMFTPGSALPAFYGAGAFPLNYPNAWDRAHGRTGYGIWLHGVPAGTYSRPPHASEGCLVLANDDLLALKQIIQVGETPVIFSDHVDWVTPERQAARRAEIEARIESWRVSWLKHNGDAYENFYARDFRGGDGSSKPHFVDIKPSSGKDAAVEIKLSDLNLFAYPGQEDLMLAQFTQDYTVDKVSTVSRREQYWQRQSNGRWKIAHEDVH